MIIILESVDCESIQKRLAMQITIFLESSVLFKFSWDQCSVHNSLQNVLLLLLRHSLPYKVAEEIVVMHIKIFRSYSLHHTIASM